MKKRFTFVYEFLSGGWSFLCIYADTLKEAEEMFWRQMTEFVEKKLNVSKKRESRKKIAVFYNLFALCIDIK